MSRLIRHYLSILLICVCLLAGTAPAQAQQHPAVATDAQGRPIRIHGSIAIIEPDIELSLITAGGLQEPRKEWSDTARRLYPQAAHAHLIQAGAVLAPDFSLPDTLDPTSHLAQLLRLHAAVARSIALYSAPGSVLATKKDPATGRPRMDWTLGPGVSELQQATGADYALFTYVRDSYTSGGRAALRTLALLAGIAMGSPIDIGGGMQIGVATLVDLHTGRVVWFNLIAKGSGDLRNDAGARATVAALLRDLPL
ncbi:hypothetical protein [Thermomonas alba]|uniref:hypothetical protein n=1 Tax=Thermomonas alba TaxID=2888525 RepID=UPI001F03E62C|nr:hypothetical protein [Thermomonas alba]